MGLYITASCRVRDVEVNVRIVLREMMRGGRPHLGVFLEPPKTEI
jgi:hypothetical protein